MPIEQITTPIFLSVSKETRDKIRKEFLIGMSGHAEVVTDQFGKATVLCDGTTNSDLQNLTVEKMRDFLGTAAVNETVYDLFKRVVEKLEYVEPVETVVTTVEPVKEETKTVEVDSKIVGDKIKCEKCDFESASKFAMRMHVSRKHK
jgi:hypothetical protein